MQRIQRMILAGFCTFAMVPPALAGSKKEEKPLDPLTVRVENACPQELALKIGELALKVAAGATTDPQTIQYAPGWSYPVLALDGSATGELGQLGFEPGGDYHLRLSECRAGAADVTTEDLRERPAAVSPQAAPQVRFRARQNTNLEYRPGDKGAFKPLSIALTRYQENQAGPFEFTFRLRAAKRGPRF